MQEKWDQYICEKLQFYQQIFDKKKNKFVKLSESPSKYKWKETSMIFKLNTTSNFWCVYQRNL